MTTIYELEKQVAPRPWVPVNPDDYPGEDEGGITQKGREDYCIARAYDGDVQLTATFIMHCRNHFMEALEALKHAHTSLRTFTWSPHWTTSDDDTLAMIEKTIDEMETVE